MKPNKKLLFSLLFTLLIIITLELSLQILSYSFIKKKTATNGFTYAPYVDYLNTFLATKNHFNEAPGLWLFGGSTMRGDSCGNNSSDTSYDWNIPHNLADLLYKNNKKYQIYNFAVNGYIFNQERILFFELLKNNPKPGIVIFYDGANEMIHGSNLPYSFTTYKKIIEQKMKIRGLINNLKNKPLKLTSVISFLKSKKTTQDKLNHFNIYNNKSFLTVVENYKLNINLIQTVCDKYKIQCFFVWQPMAFTSVEIAETNALIEYDKDLREKDNFLFLGDIFEGKEHEFFCDGIHLQKNSTGYKIVAKAMFQLIFNNNK